jgi:glycosyltransferase involved in cell wall biosynthesis
VTSRILFVTWDGPQVSYLEGLFLPIFERLESHGAHFDVLQFRWGNPSLTKAIADRCAAVGIGYRAVPVHRGIPAVGPFATAVLHAREITKAVREFGSDSLMPRSLMPALAVLTAGGRRFRPILFDADGLDADERADFRGLSRSGLTYRLLTAIERRTVRESRAVIVRTDEAAAILAERASVGRERFHRVTNGRDPAIFRPSTVKQRRNTRSSLGLHEVDLVLVYAGSIGPQYRLDQVAATFAAVCRRQAGARLLFLTSTPEQAVEDLERYQPGIGKLTTALQALPQRVPELLAAADVGLAFRAVNLSTRAIAPIKIGEYLLCGLPIVGTAGVGETAPASDAGIFFADSEGPEAAAEWITGTLLPNRKLLAGRARKVGLAHFSIERSVRDYLNALRE